RRRRAGRARGHRPDRHAEQPVRCYGARWTGAHRSRRRLTPGVGGRPPGDLWPRSHARAGLGCLDLDTSSSYTAVIVRHMVPRAPPRREGNRLVHCPFCRHGDSRAVDSRTAEDGASIRRRRPCPECGRRITALQTTSLNVMKRSGAVEPFSRDKVIAGVRKACQGRPVSEDDLALLAQKVEEAVRATGVAEVDAHEVGLTILGPLRDLDEVAYLRFASVYQAFSSLEDFEAAIATLRNERSASAPLE